MKKSFKILKISKFKLLLYVIGILFCLEIAYTCGIIVGYYASNNVASNDYVKLDFENEKNFPKYYNDIIGNLRYSKGVKWYYGTITNPELSGQYYSLRDEIHINSDNNPKSHTLVHEYTHYLRHTFPLTYKGELSEEELTDLIAYYLEKNVLDLPTDKLILPTDGNNELICKFDMYYLSKPEVENILNRRGEEYRVAKYYAGIERGEEPFNISKRSGIINILNNLWKKPSSYHAS